MNPRRTWLWLCLAAGLFGFIFVYERYLRKPEVGPQPLIPGLRAEAVVSVEVQPAGKLPIHARRTDGAWQLTEPLAYPAASTNIEDLLVFLEKLTPAYYLTPAELRTRPKAGEEFGFDPPQASLIVEQSNSVSRLWIGHLTAPGDQVFVQVVGIEGVYVADAGLLRRLPRSDHDWRTTVLAGWDHLQFDSVAVTNAGKVLELQSNSTNKLWRVRQPMDARADSGKVVTALRGLHDLRVREFVGDQPNADLDAFGLQTPDLSLAFFQGTNSVLLLQFGKSPTNDASLVYARRSDRNAIVTVPKERLEAWRASLDFRDFFDRHLFSHVGPLDQIEITADDHFVLQAQTNGAWRVMPPQDLPCDTGLVQEFVGILTNMEVKIDRNAVTESALADYGLATPARDFILRNSQAGDGVIARLQFGLNGTNCFARRVGETFVYKVRLEDFLMLPSASFQFRERRIWNFNETNVAQIVVHQLGKIREIVRKGPMSWSLGTNSQGVINPLPMDELAHQLGELSAFRWMERGNRSREARGFTSTNAYQIAVELKDGRTCRVEFGGMEPPGYPYAETTVDGEPWIFLFPWPLYYNWVQNYLTIPAYIP